jgi:hypothetical protein
MSESFLFSEADVIHRYTRAEALQDGVLVAIPASVAASQGFTCHFAVTASVAAAFFDGAQELEARQVDLVKASRRAVVEAKLAQRVRPGREDRVSFGLLTRDDVLLDLELVVGPGDDGERVLTLMQVGED